MHVCPMITVLVPHVGGPVLPPGCLTVLIGGMPAARMGDMALCVGPPDIIILGAPTVLIGGMPAGANGRRNRSWGRHHDRLSNGVGRIKQPDLNGASTDVNHERPRENGHPLRQA